MAIVRRSETAPMAQRGREWDPFQAMRELMSWDPFQEMAPRLLRRMGERMAYMPDFDVRETKDAYVFNADLPGFRDQDIDVNITGNRLTVSGQREAEEVADTDTCYCTERTYGSFTRSFTLPEGIDAGKIQANLKDGVLNIDVPKTMEAQPKHIPLGMQEKKIKA